MRSHQKRQSPTDADPAEQSHQGDQEDATSGSEGGGPRIGYSEADKADWLKFPKPNAPQPREGE
ncbi:MAG: hypothetical protein JNG89_12640 [Planctomycetaceae bacterium]|nr:hypothetical protein [Planctomycetaceae bacterium]